MLSRRRVKGCGGRGCQEDSWRASVGSSMSGSHPKKPLPILYHLALFVRTGSYQCKLGKELVEGILKPP